jgi:hypothetical protein
MSANPWYKGDRFADPTDTVAAAAFNKVYLRSLPAEFAPLITDLLSTPARLALLAELTSSTWFPVDTQIMVMGEPPYTAMWQRDNAGYSAVAPFQPNGSNLPPIPAGTIPIGWIKVSLDPSDYPIHPAYKAQSGPFEPWRAMAAPGDDPDGVGSVWHPLKNDRYPVYALYPRDGQVANGRLYEKQWWSGHRGIPQKMWVRMPNITII